MCSSATLAASQVAQWKRMPCQCRRCKKCGFDPWVRKAPWSRKWQPTPVFLPGKFHGQRSLAGYNPWCHKESDTTKYACRKCMCSVLFRIDKDLLESCSHVLSFSSVVLWSHWSAWSITYQMNECYFAFPIS